MAVEMRNLIQSEFGLDVPPMRFLEGLSLNGLTALLMEHIGKDIEDSSAVATESLGVEPRSESKLSEEEASQILDRVEELSDEEVDTLLRELLPQPEGLE